MLHVFEAIFKRYISAKNALVFSCKSTILANSNSKKQDISEPTGPLTIEYKNIFGIIKDFLLRKKCSNTEFFSDQ